MPCPSPFAQPATKQETLRAESDERKLRAQQLEQRVLNAAKNDVDEDGNPLSHNVLAQRFGMSRRGIQNLLAKHGHRRIGTERNQMVLSGPGAQVGVALDVTECFGSRDVARVIERRGGSIHGSWDDL